MTIYYVATDGDDSGRGGADSPWRTISHAMRANLKPGDEVVVRSGTYNEAVVVSKDGSAAGAITLRSEVPGGAKIVPAGNKAGITVLANHVKVDGFDLSGSESAGITGMNVHHVEITHNVIHGNVGDGIFFGKFDFLTIEGNTVHGNAARGAASGIHLKAAVNLTGSTSDEYRVIVRGNVAYDNATEYGPRTDGSGISLDDFRNTQIPSLPAYAFKSLIEDNLVFSNSGRGIQVAWSDHVTVRGNVSMANNADGRSGPWLGELVNMGSNDNHWTGNIAVTDAGNPAIANLTFDGDPTNAKVTWTDNATFNGKAGDASTYANAGGSKPSAADGNLLGHDPELTLADLKALAQDLREDGSFDIPRIGDDGPDGLVLVGGAGDDLLIGSGEDDRLYGGGGSDKLYGGNGADLLNGDAGSDRLIGGGGADTVTGGAGADTFIFRYVANAVEGEAISDFSRGQGDRIDLAEIDASAKAAGDQSFAFIGARAFSDKAGELHYVNGVLSGDVNGDGKADFVIEIAKDAALAWGDFIL